MSVPIVSPVTTYSELNRASAPAETFAEMHRLVNAATEGHDGEERVLRLRILARAAYLSLMVEIGAAAAAGSAEIVVAELREITGAPPLSAGEGR